MEIHNLMESLVTRAVDDVCREIDEAKTPHLCTSPACRLDVVCYVLNRIAPRYVSSARGMAHLSEEFDHDNQLQVDLLRLVHEGLQRVSAVSRRYYGAQEPADSTARGISFNFPTVRVRLLDGTSFFPVSGVTATLMREGSPVAMFDQRWSNPYEVSRQTPGLALFWPAPIPAEHKDEDHLFTFTLEVGGDPYDTLCHTFDLSVRSRDSVETMVSLQRDHQLPDLYLFTRGTV